MVSAFTVVAGWQLIPAQDTYTEKAEERVGFTSNTILQLKSIKMSGLAGIITDQLQQLFVDEIDSAKWKMRVESILELLSEVINRCVPAFIMGAMIYGSDVADNLTTARTFAITALVFTVCNPLQWLVVFSPLTIGLFVSLARIEDFLNLEERQDNRQTWEERAKEADAALARAVGSPPPTPGASSNKFFAELVDVTVTSQEEEPRDLFKNVSVGFSPRTLTVVTGAVNCGKSVFLKAITGEAELASGSVFVDKQAISYCSHQPWLENVSVRDNIVGNYEYVEGWYQSILFACCLLDEVHGFTDGDDTIVGNGGFNLSGGQKQRLALARAIYARKPLVVLDDIFSALDRLTARSVFRRCFGPFGLLRTSQTAVIMTSTRPEHLARADKVLRITSSATVEIVRQIPRFDVNDHDGEMDFREEEDTGHVPLDRPLKLGRRASKQEPPKPELGNLRDELQLYAYYISTVGKTRMLAWTVILVLTVVLTQAQELLLCFGMADSLDKGNYYRSFIGVTAAYVVAFASMGGVYYFVLSPKSTVIVHRELLETVMGATLPFLSKTSVGSLLNKFSQDMHVVSQGLPEVFIHVAFSALLLIVESVVIGINSSKNLIAIPIVIIGASFLQRTYLQRSRKMRYLELEAIAPLYTQFTDTAQGVGHIRTFGWQDSHMKRMFERLDCAQRPHFYIFSNQRWLAVMSDLGTAVAGLFVITMALKYPSSTGQAALGLSLLTLVRFNETLAWWVRAWVMLESSLAALSRVTKFVTTTPLETAVQEKDMVAHNEAAKRKGKMPVTAGSARTVANRPSQKPSASSSNWTNSTARSQSEVFSPTVSSPDIRVQLWGLVSPPTSWPSAGEITFKNVFVRYDGSSSRAALREVNFTVTPGMKLGLFGKTGSGKSTLLTTMLNFLQYEGDITIDGVDLRSVPCEDLRARVTCLPQDSVLLLGTIRQNMFPYAGDGPPEDDLIEALKTVELWAFVEGQGGLDVTLQDIDLSQGQVQLLCVARAMLHHQHVDSKLVLLDEPTSHIDPEQDRRLQAIIASAFQDVTVIMVAHRHETTENMTHMLEMNNGRALGIMPRDVWLSEQTRRRNLLTSSSSSGWLPPPEDQLEVLDGRLIAFQPGSPTTTMMTTPHGPLTPNVRPRSKLEDVFWNHKHSLDDNGQYYAFTDFIAQLCDNRPLNLTYEVPLKLTLPPRRLIGAPTDAGDVGEASDAANNTLIVNPNSYDSDRIDSDSAVSPIRTNDAGQLTPEERLGVLNALQSSMQDYDQSAAGPVIDRRSLAMRAIDAELGGYDKTEAMLISRPSTPEASGSRVRVTPSDSATLSPLASTPWTHLVAPTPVRPGTPASQVAESPTVAQEEAEEEVEVGVSATSAEDGHEPCPPLVRHSSPSDERDALGLRRSDVVQAVPSTDTPSPRTPMSPWPPGHPSNGQSGQGPLILPASPLGDAWPYVSSEESEGSSMPSRPGSSDSLAPPKATHAAARPRSHSVEESTSGFAGLDVKGKGVAVDYKADDDRRRSVV